MDFLLNKQYTVLVPILFPLAYLIGGMVIFCTLTAMGRQPRVHDNKETEQLVFMSRFLHWMVRPVERAAIRLKITPNQVTVTSLLVCASAGAALATGHLAVATWSYAIAGILDIVDGRLARATGKQSNSGAFLDSVLDRWGELAVFGGMAWLVRDTWALGAVLVAMGASMMVSYTRARGESLGVVTSGGAMQRPERIVLVVAGCLAAAIADANPFFTEYVPTVLGTSVAIVGALSAMTAFGRLRAGYRMLDGKSPSPRAQAEAFSDDDTPVPEQPVARVLKFRPGDRATGTDS